MSSAVDDIDEIRKHIERIKNPSSAPMDYTKKPGEWEKSLPAAPTARTCPYCDPEGGCTGTCCD